MGFPGGSVVKNSPAVPEPQEMRVRSLGREDPLEEGMATHSSILAWRIPMDRGAWQATTHRVEKNQIRLKQLGTQVHYAFGSHFTERWMNMMEGVPRCALHPRRHSHLSPHLSPQEPEPRPHPTPAPPPTHSI